MLTLRDFLMNYDHRDEMEKIALDHDLDENKEIIDPDSLVNYHKSIEV